MNRIAGALLLGLAAGAAAQEEPRPSQPQPEAGRAGRTARFSFSRNLLIAGEPAAMDLDASLASLQWGPIVAALPPELRPEKVVLRPGAGLGPSRVWILSIDISARDHADLLRSTEFLAQALQARLAREGEILLEQRRELLAGAPQRLKLAEERRQALQAEMNQCLVAAARVSRSEDLARTAELLREIAGRRAEAEIDLAARRARLEALGKAIAAAAREAREAGGRRDDPIAAELESILAGRERALERMKLLHGQGQGSSEELEGAQTRLSEARIALLERREALARESGSLELLARLKGEQTDLVLELAELETRLKATAAQQQALEESRARLEQAIGEQEAIKLELNRLRKECAEAERAHREAAAAAAEFERLQGGSPPPRVILLD